MNTPEQVDLAKRLDQVFSPAYWRQMREFYERQPNPMEARFVHYTSADAALKIIQSKRIWMRNVTAMSDYSEVRHGHRILSELLKDPLNRKPLVGALDSCAPGAAEGAFKLFDSWWNDISLNTYVASISEHDQKEDRHGRLSMWRAFGGHTARVGLVFKVSMSLLSAGVLNLIFSPVAYLTEPEVKEQFVQVVKNIRDSSDFLKSLGDAQIRQAVFGMLVAGVTCLKHEGFKEEREWRLIYGPKRSKSEFIECSTEVVGGIPQTIYKIPLDAKVSDDLKAFDLAQIFDHLIIGPTQYPWSMCEAFINALKNAGVPERENLVVMSQIPIRT